MKSHYYLQGSFLVLIGMLVLSAATVYGAEESIVLTTYYPSPYGVYGEMRLYPKASAICNDKQEGLMYYDNDPPSERGLRICVCKNPPCPPGGFDWMPATGYWAASPFNSNNIYNTNSGNVGIGTSNPGAKLDIYRIDRGPTTMGHVKFGGNNNWDSDMSFDGASDGIFVLTNTGIASGGTAFYSSATSLTPLVIQNMGNVGIGTTNPLLKLVVNANSGIRNGMQIADPRGHYLSIGGGIDTQGHNSAGFHIGTVGGLTPGGVGGGIVYDYTTNAIGIFSAYNISIASNAASPPLGAGDTIFSTGGVERMRITNSGNVGIGTATPLPSGWPVSVRLGVEGGAIRSDSNRIYFTGADGAGMFWINSGPDEGGAPVSNPGGDNVIGWNNAPGFPGRQVVIMGTTIIGQFPPVPGWARQNLLVSGNVGIGTGGSGYQLELSLDSAAKPNGGDWAAVSDERLKTNIKPLAGALEKITALKGVQFEWRNPEEHASGAGEIRAGFIAQDVEKVFPQFINEIDASGKDKALTPNGKIESLSLPIDFNAYLVEAIKELKEENDALKVRIEAVEKK